MERKDFLKNGIAALGFAFMAPMVAGCSKENDLTGNSSTTGTSGSTSGSCTLSPSETNGPYPIITPSSYIRSNIVGDRTGVAMTLTITVDDKSNGCSALSNVLVDIWHCDKDGNYSQYGSYSSANWLRGRQTTDSSGKVTFTSIFPGWYKGRAPHIHVEVLSATGSSLLVTQLAFPVDVYTTVYASSGYHGAPDTSNSSDNILNDSLSGNMVDSATGSVSIGYNVLKTITVA